MEEKWVLIKPYTCEYGTIPENSDIYYFRGAYYLNGGLIPPEYYGLFNKLINDTNYTRKMKVIKDSF